MSAEILEVGDELVLRVVEHPKTGEPAFEPDWLDKDPLIDDEEWSQRSVRLFGPMTEKEEERLEVGEEWRVEVTVIEVGSTRKTTRDGRRYVFVEVSLVEREEVEKFLLDQAMERWTRVIICGKKMISSEFIETEEAERRYFVRERGKIVICKEIIWRGAVIGRVITSIEPITANPPAAIRGILGRRAPRAQISRGSFPVLTWNQCWEYFPQQISMFRL